MNIKSFVSKYIINIMSFILALFILIFSVITYQGLFTSFSIFLIFGLLCGMGFCYRKDDFVFINKTKQIIQLVWMILLIFLNFYLLSPVTDTIKLASNFYILVFIQFVFICVIISNIICFFIDKKINSKDVYLFKGNLIYWLQVILFCIVNTYTFFSSLIKLTIV